MRKWITYLLAASAAVLSNVASAEFGEKVNCRIETTGQVSIYQGWASCNVDGYHLSQFVHATTLPAIRLTQWQGGSYKSCSASVPFYKKEDVTQEVCDYKPQANFNLVAFYDGTAYQASLRVNAQGRDFDGNISRHQFWVNGVYKGASVAPITVSSFTQFTVKYTVTDNDGYTHTQTQSIIVDPGDDPCFGGPGEHSSC